jgi:hypothetical protein
MAGVLTCWWNVLAEWYGVPLPWRLAGLPASSREVARS